MKRLVRQSAGLLVLALFFMGSGCAQLNKFVNPKSAGEKADEADAKVEQAIQNGDLAVLKKVCKDKKIGQSQVRFTTVKKACVETGKLMGTEIAGVECDKVDAYWANAKEMGSEVKGNLHNSYGLKLAECDRWDTLFVELMHWGLAWDRGSNGYKLIAKLDEAGEPVEDKFLDYLETTDKPLAIEHSAYAMSHFLKWRMDTEEGKPCGAYVPAMDKLDAGASHNLLVFFKEKSCKEAASAAVSKLAADSPNTRIVACQLLGKVGDKSHLKKVEIVATKDGYSKEKNRTVVYPVRDACSQAMAKIELSQ